MEGRVERRSDVEIVDEKIECQKKKKRFGRDGSSSMDTTDDRISQLPDHLLHHILSYLSSTRDVVSISVLSKTWHRVWTSFPIWDFCESLLGLAVANSGMEGSEIKDRREKFFHFVLNSLLRQCHNNGGIQKFRLSMTLDPQLASPIFHWITLAAQNGVTQLDLNFQVPIPSCNYVYCLPQTIFSAKELKVFKFSGFRLKLLLNLDSSINWPSLQVLSLDKVYVDERVIQNLNRSCPLIEKLALLYCFNLRSIILSGFEKLNKVKVVETNDSLKRIEIDVPSLRTFSFAGGFKDCPNIDVTAACKNLEVLKLRSCTITNQVCQDLISKFPSLKTLSYRCFLLSRINIVSQRLEKLELSSSFNQVDATIVTPRLQSFKYDAPYTPSVFSLCGSGLQKVCLKLFPKYLSAYRFLKMREYLGNFNQIKLLTLHIVLGPVTFEHERLKDTAFPVVVEHLKLKITSSLSGADAQARSREYHEALVDGLLWICHPESLLLVSGWGSNNEFMKALCQKLMHRAERPDCCTDSLIKCWWHELKGMSIKQFERNEETTCDILFESLPTLAPQQRIGFAFKW